MRNVLNSVKKLLVCPKMATVKLFLHFIDGSGKIVFKMYR